MGYTDDILKSIASEKKPGDVEQAGVKGMKWGVRKDDNDQSESSSAPKPTKEGQAQIDRNGGKKPTVVTENGNFQIIGASPDEMNGQFEAMQAIYNDEDLSDEEKKEALDKLQNDFLRGLQKKYGLTDKEAGLEKKVSGFEKFFEDFGKNLDKLGKNIDKTVKDTKKNVSDFIGDAVENVKKSLKHSATEITFSSLHDGSEEKEDHGVKGMRWGFRKATTRGGTPPSKRKAKGSKSEDDDKKKESADSKLSTSELRDRNERIRLSQEYAKMTTQKKAENVVSEVLKSVAKKSVSRALETVATDILTRSLGMAAKKALPKIYVNTNAIAKAAEEAAKAAKG